jgi:hypothetical protein
MMKRLFLSGLLLASLCLSLTGTATAGFVNGSFETGDLTGWTSDSPFGLNPFGTAYGSGMDGIYWHWLGGFDTPGITTSQTLTGLTIGTTYAVDFIMASEFVSSTSLNVSVDGGPKTVFTAPPYNGTPYWDNWVPQEFQFTASATTATVTFDAVGLNQNDYDVGLDNVTLSEVQTAAPEPGTWMLLGLGISGLAFLRRR